MAAPARRLGSSRRSHLVFIGLLAEVERDVLELNHVRHLPPHRPATQAITTEGDPYQAAVVRAALSYTAASLLARSPPLSSQTLVPDPDWDVLDGTLYSLRELAPRPQKKESGSARGCEGYWWGRRRGRVYYGTHMKQRAKK